MHLHENEWFSAVGVALGMAWRAALIGCSTEDEACFQMLLDGEMRGLIYPGDC